MLVEAMVEAVRAFARLCDSDNEEISLLAAGFLKDCWDDLLLRDDLGGSLWPEDEIVGACSDDFICDECVAADEEDRFYGTLNAIIDDYTASSAPRNFPNPSILNDMPPVFICGFGFSEN